MKNLLVAFIFLFPILLHAQNVGINTDGLAPHSSAQLDVRSFSKGILIPRIPNSQIANIASPANGLIVYNSTLNKLVHYDQSNNEWLDIANMEDLYRISDADADTKIVVEESADEDRIKMYAGGNLMIEMKADTMYIPQGVFSGYGTTNPLDPIHVKAEDDDEYAGFYAEGGANTKHVHYILDNRTGNGRRYSLVSVGDDSSIPNGSFAIRDLNLSTERLTIDALGNVGISKNFPLAKFHVAGDAKFDNEIQLGGLNGFAAPGAIQYTGSDIEGFVGGAWKSLTETGTTDAILDVDADTKILVEETPDEDKVKFYAEGDLVMEMESDKVYVPKGVFSGYGTTTPLDPIHVVAEDDDEFAGFYAEGGANTKHVHYILDNRTGNGRRYSLVSVGDDSSIPNGSFAIRDLNLSTERLTIDALGNVGISKNYPLAKFHVAGDAKFDNEIQLGGLNGFAAPGAIQYTGSDFEGYVGGAWKSLTGTGATGGLSDTDDDTKVVVEETPDEDKVKFYAEGNLMMEMKTDNIFVPQGVFSGYGLTNPLDPIHVKAEDDDEYAGFYAEGGANTKHVHYILDNRTGNGRRYSLVSVGDDSNIPNGSFAIRDLNLSTERLTIDSTGRIGMGTNTPFAKLEIKHNSGYSGQLSLIETEADDYARIHFFNEGSPDFWTVSAGEDPFSDENSMNFSRNGIAQMRISESGKISMQDSLDIITGGLRVSDHITIKKNADGEAMLDVGNLNTLFLGKDAGILNTAGNNTFLGAQCGNNNTTGNNNLFVGFRGGSTMVNGNGNTFSGAFAGGLKTGGNGNTLLGYNAGKNNATGAYNVFLGNQAGENEAGSRKLYIDNSNTSSPLIYGDFLVDSVQINGHLKTTGRFYIGNESIRSPGVNFLRVDANFTPEQDNVFNIGGSAFRWKNVYATSGVVNTSDKRMKKNIEGLGYGLKEVMALRPVDFNWKKENDADKKTIGLIAQELLAVIPEVVVEPENAEELYGVKYADLVPVLIKAIQELEAEKQQLESTVSELTAEVIEGQKEQDFFNNRLARLELLLNQTEPGQANTRK